MELRSVGRFVLVEPLRVASTASRLYLARGMDEADDLPPSLLAKMLVPARSADHAIVRAQFEHEARLLQAFNHPCIPACHGAAEQDGVAYVLVDYVQGVDLATLLGHDRDQPRALDKELAVYVMGQIADAVRHIHTFEAEDEDGEPLSLEILHRDICPANVLLSREGDVLLTDFGSATSRLLAPEHDMPGAGHKAYMAPERVTGTGRATVQSDLFSMAVVLWEMLRGERCFRAASELETMDAIVRFDITHVSRRVAGLSPKLGEILRKNLDRDPERRYESAYHMLQRLAQAPEAKSAEDARARLGRMVSELADDRG